MEPAHNITQRMEGLTIKPEVPKARAVTPHAFTTTMESAQQITKDMEHMTLNPKSQIVTTSTATSSSYGDMVFSHPQPQSNSYYSAGPITTSTTGGYTYATTPTTIVFSNPDASVSRSADDINSSSSSQSVSSTFFGAGATDGYPYMNTPTTGSSSFLNPSSTANSTVPTPSTHQPQNPDIGLFVKELLVSDDPVALYKYNIYHFRQTDKFPNKDLKQRHSGHTPYRPPLRRTLDHKISKSRSHPSLRERYHRDRRQLQIQAPFSSTLVHKAEIKRLPTETICVTKAEEKAEEERDKRNAEFLMRCLRRSKERVAEEKAAAKEAAAAKRPEVERREKMWKEWNALSPISPELKEMLDGWRCGTDILMYGGEELEEDGDEEVVGEGVEKEKQEFEGLEYAIPRRTGPAEDDVMTDGPNF